MLHTLNKALLSSLTVGIILGLSVEVKAVTLFRGTQILSDMPEFLNLQFNLFEISAPFGTNPPGQFGFPPAGPIVPLFLGENWKVFVSRDAGSFVRGTGISLFAEQVVQSPNLVRPQAKFAGGTNRFDFYPFPAEQVSYLTNAPVGSFDAVTCPFGANNCVSYEFGALFSDSICGAACPPIGLRNPIFELKGFFNSSESPEPVPETETGFGALAAMGLMILARMRQGHLKNNSNPLP
jgi:hypothetical protein